jgi:hypothetical protein
MVMKRLKTFRQQLGTVVAVAHALGLAPTDVIPALRAAPARPRDRAPRLHIPRTRATGHFLHVEEPERSTGALSPAIDETDPGPGR